MEELLAKLKEYLDAIIKFIKDLLAKIAPKEEDVTE